MLCVHRVLCIWALPSSRVLYKERWVRCVAYHLNKVIMDVISFEEISSPAIGCDYVRHKTIVSFVTKAVVNSKLPLRNSLIQEADTRFCNSTWCLCAVYQKCAEFSSCLELQWFWGGIKCANLVFKMSTTVNSNEAVYVSASEAIKNCLHRVDMHRQRKRHDLARHLTKCFQCPNTWKLLRVCCPRVS